MNAIRILACTITLASALMMQACSSVEYSAEPIEAWVVDADTNEPLEDVVVVADWVLEGGISVNNFTKVNRIGDLVIMEAVTDKNGRFSFPAWGPKRATEGMLDDKDPRLLFFKSGYEYVGVDNSQYSRPMKYSDMGKPSGTESKPQGPLRKSFWNGETVKMKKFAGSLVKYSEHLSILSSRLDSFIFSAEGKCDWRNIPLVLRALDKQDDLFQKNYISRSTFVASLRSNEKYFRENGCGSVSEFLNGRK